MFKKVLIGLIILSVSGCKISDSRIASNNISNDADNFLIYRRILFFNGITDKVLLTIEGRCSIYKDNVDRQLEVTCKVGEGEGEYKKHYLGISDNVTYIVEQLEKAKVSSYHYKVRFKPQSIIPSIELKWNNKDEATASVSK